MNKILLIFLLCIALQQPAMAKDTILYCEIDKGDGITPEFYLTLRSTSNGTTWLSEAINGYHWQRLSIEKETTVKPSRYVVEDRDEFSLITITLNRRNLGLQVMYEAVNHYGESFEENYPGHCFTRDEPNLFENKI